MTLDYKDIKIRKSEFVAKTQLLSYNLVNFQDSQALGDFPRFPDIWEIFNFVHFLNSMF